MLKACDILNYFIKDLFYERSITYIHKIFMAFEDEIDPIGWTYPGGTFNKENMGSYDARMRPWYT